MALTLAQRLNDSKLDTLVIEGVLWEPSSVKTNGNVCTIECRKDSRMPLPPEIVSTKRIKNIRIEWCDNLDLTQTFLMLADVPNLTKLHLKNCSIKDLPSELWMLYKLKYLSFSNDTLVENNEFEIFPPEIGFLEDLQELDLCNNRRFKIFPPEAAKLNRLEFINLRELHKMPENIELIPNLKRLGLVKSYIKWADVEMLVDRPNGLESVTVDDNSYAYFNDQAKKYPNVKIFSEDSGHISRGSYL